MFLEAKLAAFNEKKLIRQFNQGSKEALCQIYQHIKNDLYCLAVSLLNDSSAAEDAVHDVFVSFARQAGNFTFQGKLKSYLCTCIVNRTRDMLRHKSRKDTSPQNDHPFLLTELSPDQYVIETEDFIQLHKALSKIPPEQREIILMHLHHNMTFKEIACAQGVSINTVNSRYRYGLNKLSFYVKETQNETVQTNRRLDSTRQA